MFVNNTKTWVYHFLPCFYGDQISGDSWTLSEACSQTLAVYAADTQHPWDACYLCLPQYHKLRAGHLTSFYKIPSAVGSGPITGNYRLQGTLIKQTQSGEFGDSSFDHTYQIEPTVPDAYGNVIVRNVTPKLAPGDWKIIVTSTDEPGWEVEVTGFVDFWTPLAIDLTFSSLKTDPHQVLRMIRRFPLGFQANRADRTQLKMIRQGPGNSSTDHMALNSLYTPRTSMFA